MTVPEVSAPGTRAALPRTIGSVARAGAAILLAARMGGGTRLIDNVVLEPAV